MSFICVKDTNNNRANINLPILMINQPIKIHGIVKQIQSQSLEKRNKKLQIWIISSCLLHWITDFIKNYPFKNNREKDITYLKGFRQATYLLVLAMFESSWDTLKIRESNKTFWLKMIENFNWIPQSNESSNKKDKPVILKPVDFSNLSPSSSVPPRLSKEELKKLKFHGEYHK